MNDPTRPFPHALGAEKSVLSSMLQDPAQFVPLASEHGLTEAHFYLQSHQIIFRQASDSFEAGEAIDLVTLVQKFLDLGLLDRVGGAAAVYDIYGYALMSDAFSHHAGIIRDKFIMRSMLNLCAETTQQVYDAPDEASDTLQTLERGITSIAAVASGAAPLLTLKTIILESVDQFERRAKGSQDTVGIPTIGPLDMYLKGIHPGRVWIIGAYPGGGKSVMASQIIVDAALSDYPCLFLSLEMSERDLMDRMIIQASRVDARAFTEPREYARENGSGEISTGLVRAIKGVVPRLVAAPLRLQRPANRNISTIISCIRRAHRETGIKIAAVDYLQLIRAKSDNKEAEVSEISHALQEVAQDLQITVLALSQLNADGDTKHGRVIEEDADAVISIIQDRDKASETYKQHRHIIIAKDRHYGSEGTRVPLILNRETIRFVQGEDSTKAGGKTFPKNNS